MLVVWMAALSASEMAAEKANLKGDRPVDESVLWMAVCWTCIRAS